MRNLSFSCGSPSAGKASSSIVQDLSSDAGITLFLLLTSSLGKLLFAQRAYTIARPQAPTLSAEALPAATRLRGRSGLCFYCFRHSLLLRARDRRAPRFFRSNDSCLPTLFRVFLRRRRGRCRGDTPRAGHPLPQGCS